MGIKLKMCREYLDKIFRHKAIQVSITTGNPLDESIDEYDFFMLLSDGTVVSGTYNREGIYDNLLSASFYSNSEEESPWFKTEITDMYWYSVYKRLKEIECKNPSFYNSIMNALGKRYVLIEQHFDSSWN